MEGLLCGLVKTLSSVHGGMFAEASPLEDALRNYLTGPGGGTFASLLLGQAALERLARVHDTTGGLGDARDVIKAATECALDYTTRPDVYDTEEPLMLSEKGDFIVRQCNARSTPLRILGMALVERCAKVAGNTEALHAALSLACKLHTKREPPRGAGLVPDSVSLETLKPHGHCFIYTGTQAGRTCILLPCPSERVLRASEAPPRADLPIVRSIGTCVLRLDGQGRTCVCVAYSHVAPVVPVDSQRVRDGVRCLLVLFDLYTSHGVRMTRSATDLAQLHDAWTTDESGDLYVSAKVLRVHDLLVAHTAAAALNLPRDDGSHGISALCSRVALGLAHLNAAFVAAALRDLGASVGNLDTACAPLRPLDLTRALTRPGTPVERLLSISNNARLLLK